MLFFLIGQSNTGKDTIKKAIVKDGYANSFVCSTTRPMRANEKEGVDYYFRTKEEFAGLESKNNVLESRKYTMADGNEVIYFTELQAFDSNIDYITVGTIEQYKNLKNTSVGGLIVPIFVSVSDETRLLRGINRAKVLNTSLKEVARRFYDEFNEYTQEALDSIENLYTISNETGDVTQCIWEIEMIISAYREEE